MRSGSGATCKTAPVRGPRSVRPARPGLVGDLAIGVLALAGLGFGVAATAGLWRDPGSRLAAANVTDGINYTWWLGQIPHALGHGRNPLYTPDLNWPEGVAAMNNTSLLLPAVVLAPVTALTSAMFSYGLLNLLAVPACALAGYWSLRQVPWTRRDGDEVRLGRAAALAGACVFAISPAIVNSLIGHITMAFAPGLPVLMVLAVRAWHGGAGRVIGSPVRTGLLLGLVAAAQLFTGEEILFQAAVGVLVVLLVAALSRPRAAPAAARRLLTALGGGAVLFLVVTGYPLWQQFFGPLKEHGSPFLLNYFGADLHGFTTPTSQLLFHTSADAEAATHFPGGLEEHLAYLGWPLLVTAVLTLLAGWRRVPVRCAGAGLLVAAVLSLGGRIWVGGTWTEHAGPYRWLQQLPVAENSLASRFGVLAAGFAGAMLAFAVQLLREAGAARPVPGPASHGAGPLRRAHPVSVAGTVAAVVVVLACLLPLLPRPLTVTAAPAVPAWFTAGARQLPAGAVVMVLPYPTAADPEAMRWQTVSGYRFRMPGGSFLGPAPDGQVYLGGAADPPTAQLLSAVADSGQQAPVTAAEQAQAEQDLRAWGTTKIVLGPSTSEAALLATMTNLLGRSPQADGGVYVWDDPVTG